MKVNGKKFVESLTLEAFAGLQSARPEYLTGLSETGTGILLARIHPNCNRPVGDESVIARALVYMPEDSVGPSSLRRLTIRTGDLVSRAATPYADLNRTLDNLYPRALQAVWRLPVLELKSKVDQ